MDCHKHYNENKIPHSSKCRRHFQSKIEKCLLCVSGTHLHQFDLVRTIAFPSRWNENISGIMFVKLTKSRFYKIWKCTGEHNAHYFQHHIPTIRIVHPSREVSVLREKQKIQPADIEREKPYYCLSLCWGGLAIFKLHLLVLFFLMDCRVVFVLFVSHKRPFHKDLS